MKNFAYNRVMKNEDFGTWDVHSRKAWEIHIALKTLRDFGAVHPEAEILGVGTANEDTLYHLSRDVKRVFATDLFLEMGVWDSYSGRKWPEFLINPSSFAPGGIAYNPNRIIPMHMDMCNLRFEDNTFDAVFSSGSIEHVGHSGVPDWKAIARAAHEIGRVTKPGGIISLSTEWKIDGEGWGWGFVRLFTEELLMEHIVKASGCELIDTPDWSYDGSLDKHTSLTDIIRNGASQHDVALLSSNGFKFTSVHVALRKPS
jgi:SAM-dependent methyltransferase